MTTAQRRPEGRVPWLSALASVSLSLLAFTHTVPATAAPDAGLLHVLPQGAALVGFKPLDPPEQAAGDQLFRLINGGATLYMGAGFKRALLQDYSAPDGALISLEVYQMASPAAARTVFAHKAGKEAAASAADGKAALVEDYYGLYLQGSFYVSVTAAEVTPSARKQVESLAAAVLGKVTAPKAAPPGPAQPCLPKAPAAPSASRPTEAVSAPGAPTTPAPPAGAD